MDDFLDGLNPAQRQAVTHEGGPLLVLAGAGSGKTRIITARMIYFLRKGLLPSQILAVTFSNKAAREMRARLQPHVRGFVMIGTFHAACLRILRREADKIGLPPDFTVYDAQDQRALIKDCLKSMDIDPRRMHPKAVAERINRSKDYLIFPEDDPDGVSEEERLFQAVYRMYEERMRQCGGLDFGGLIAQTVRLFQRRPEVLRGYQQRYPVILVDEYQDTNEAQARLVTLLAGQTPNVTVVGDPDQSIYEWRGARVENIMRFEQSFPNVTMIRLEQNYRSTNTILQAANAVIACNRFRHHKDLWSEKGQGDPVRVWACADERAEARLLVETIREKQQEGRPLNQMAVFYRTHAQSRVIEEELMRQGVAYRIVGGQKFYERKEIKDLTAYLRLTYNSADEISLLRVINTPRRGLGPAALAKLTALRQKHGGSLFAALPLLAGEGAKSLRAGREARAFYVMIGRFIEASHEVTLAHLVEMVIEETGYARMLEDEGTLEARARLENIKEFYGAVQEFQQNWVQDEGPRDVLGKYLEFLSLQTAVDAWNDQENILALMTLHSAKGLEFPVVFMVGMEEGILPHGNALQGSEREIEEERRLCYVGFTRAMEQLYLLYAGQRTIFGYEYVQDPSRFLSEIPEDLIRFSEDLQGSLVP